MKKYLVLILLLSIVFLFSCKRADIKYWENGEKKSELNYKGDKLNGPSTWWYENGTKQMESNYKNNILNGKSIRWNYKGIMEREDNYVDNKLSGKSITWNKDGIIISEENYLNDTLDGEYKEWHINGQVKLSAFYNKGKYHKKWLYWNELGMKIGEADFDNGKGKMQSWDLKGNLLREINYKDNLKDGKEIWYDKEGKIEKILIFEKGQLLKEIITELENK